MVSKPVNGFTNGEVTTNGDAHDHEDLNSEQDNAIWKEVTTRGDRETHRAEFGRTPLSDIFRGHLRSRFCRESKTTDNVQPFFTLQLDIEKAGSVKEALEKLMNRDQLEGVTCAKTKREVEAWQEVTLEQLPCVLILHLKCFNYNLTCSKIIKSLEFSIELKINPKFITGTKRTMSASEKKYKLFAVVYHDGTEATKGHYVTDVFHVGLSCWLRYDDQNVKAVAEAHMLKPKSPRTPYLLYYRRCDTINTSHAPR